MLFVRKNLCKNDVKKVCEDLVCCAFFVRINSEIFTQKVLCFLKIPSILAKSLWTTRRNLRRYLEVQFTMKSREICEDECAFVFLKQNNV